MDNGIDPKPNYLELDEERSKLLEKILLGSSTNVRLDAYLNYFLKILSFKRSNIEEAFLSEFLEDYLNVVKRYGVWGNEPELTRKIFEQLLKIKDRLFTEDYAVDINNEIARLESQWTDLTNILNGIEDNTNDGRKAYFPVIDNEAPVNCYGLIESVTVRISKTDGEDKFIIIPSEKEIEQRIAEQIKIAWRLALRISSRYVRKHNQYHEVIISFDKKAGFYVGNSLGIALTLTFLEQILKFYNPTYIIKISEGSAFTGGIDEEGNVLNTGEDIIKRKVAALFYSELNSFVIPKLEESYANFALGQLKKIYPHRKLKIITAEDIDDILNRRDLVDIKKQKAIVRSGKFVKKNWIIISLICIIYALVYFAGLYDFDDNPHKFFQKGRMLHILNKNDKILWKKFMYYEFDENDKPGLMRISTKILDIDGDGRNEVIIANEADTSKKTYGLNLNKVICYNYDGTRKWEHIFNEVVSTPLKIFTGTYQPNLIDMIIENGKPILYCFAYHTDYYPGTIYKLDAGNGKIIGDVLWNSGRILDAYLGDYNEDGINEIVAVGANNGYEGTVLFSIDTDNLSGISPAPYNYAFKDKKIAKFIEYLLIPISDLAKHEGLRYGIINPGDMIYYRNDKIFLIRIIQNQDFSNQAMLYYKFDANLKLVDIDCNDRMQITRDNLVRTGLLGQPYTNNKLYYSGLKKNIKDLIQN